MGNSILVIAPYRWEGTWVFDDPATGLVREPFVAGIPEMIDALLAHKGIKANRFRLIFSAIPFPDYDEKITRVEEVGAGSIWNNSTFKMSGWLCPALLKYFPDPPPENLHQI